MYYMMHLLCFRHAHVLAALKAWSPWLGVVPEARELALEAARAVLTSLGTPNEPPPPPLVAHAAAHTLLSLTAALRCPQLGNLPEMQVLMQHAPTLPTLPDEVSPIQRNLPIFVETPY
jgi:hypothetical protein